MSLEVIILAAGQGKRMCSKQPKVLHSIGGIPMLKRVIQTALALTPKRIHVIYGHEGEKIKQSLGDVPVNWIFQKEQLGTGHAVLQTLAHLPQAGHVLILSGDVPLIEADTLKNMIQQTEQHQSLTILVATMPDPTGLGRILRNSNGQVEAIVEEKDACDSQKNINEIFTGVYGVPIPDLKHWLPALTNNNAQKEYYLTEIIHFAASEHKLICDVKPLHLYEVQGVNNRLQLQELERTFQQIQAEKLMLNGVTLADAKRIDIRGELTCGQDIFIDINCVFEGNVHLADGCRIGPNCVIINSTIGTDAVILANSVIEKSQIGSQCQIGPFARLREGTELDSGAKIGNFVETKKATFGKKSKASHLSYLGDVTIGHEVNIGAGTITCNYDGANKHQTIIEDGAFIGSDTQLIAPVTVGAHATLGAGTTLRKNAPPSELTLTESKQKTIYGWKRPQKKES